MLNLINTVITIHITPLPHHVTLLSPSPFSHLSPLTHHHHHQRNEAERRKRLQDEADEHFFLIHKDTQADLEYFASSGASTYLKLMITLDPLLSTLPTMPEEVTNACFVFKPTPFMSLFWIYTV